MSLLSSHSISQLVLPKRLNEVESRALKEHSHFPALDGLRGLAVLFVMLAHLSGNQLHILGWINMEGAGKYGVYLFYVLSSYLLDRKIMIALMQGNGSKDYWLNYMWRRFSRIIPLYFLVLTYNWCASLYFPTLPHIPLTTAEYGMHILLQEGKSIFWSIPVEFTYYLVSPLIMLFYHYVLKWRPALVIGTLLSLILASVYISQFFALPKLSLLRYLPLFLSGTFLAILDVLYWQKLQKLADWQGLILDLIGLIALVGISITIPAAFKALSGQMVAKNYFHHQYHWYSVLWALFFFATMNGQGLWRRILSWQPLRSLGLISFSLYLTHMMVLMWVRGYESWPEWLKIIVFFVVSIGIAMMTYRLIEKPLSKVYFSDLKRSFSPNREK